MTAFSTGMLLIRQSADVLSRHKAWVIFPVLSGILGAALFLALISPVWHLALLHPDTPLNQKLIAIGLMLVGFYSFNVVLLFFNAAIIQCTLDHFHQKSSPLFSYIQKSLKCLWNIMLWALFATTVGALIRLFYTKAQKTDFVQTTLGHSRFEIISYLVVPIIATENLSPLKALHRSKELFQSTWGDGLRAQFHLGFTLLLARILAILPAVIGFNLNLPLPIAIGTGITGFLLLMITIFNRGVNNIFRSAIFLYALEKKAFSPFEEVILKTIFCVIARRP